MSAFNERQGTFAFPDAGGTPEQDADATDVDQGRMQVRARGKLFLEEDGRFGRKVLRL